MLIEATSLPDPPRIVFKRRVVRLSVVFVVMIAAIAADAVARSYRYYSQIIDARLASGYLTSRPGLYAAPRVLQAEQKLSREKLVAALQRAGYVESKASDVWSGSFTVSDAPFFEMAATSRWVRAGQQSRSSSLRTPTLRRKKLCKENTRKRCWRSRLSSDFRRTTSLRSTATRST